MQSLNVHMTQVLIPSSFWRAALIVDIVIGEDTLLRPDVAIRYLRSAIPNPPPAWLKYDKQGCPTPHIAVYVAMAENLPTPDFLELLRRYTARDSPVQVLICALISVDRKEFWSGICETSGGTLESPSSPGWTPEAETRSIMAPLELKHEISMEKLVLGSEADPLVDAEYISLDAEGIRRTIKDALE
jgi:hypothetical protein